MLLRAKRYVHVRRIRLRALIWRILGMARGFREFCIDGKRYYQHSTPSGDVNFSGLSDRAVECQVTKEYHRIEKGFALDSPRRPFGAEPRSRLTQLLELPQATGRHVAHARDALEALDAWNSLGQFTEVLAPSSDGLPDFHIEESQLAAFFISRRSVRTFDQTLQPSKRCISEAVELALSTPSVCNRQAWRAHVYWGPDAAEVLRLHNGSSAFAQNIPTVMVVTIDTRLFSGAQERNQRWIDGGLFAMSLVWALHGLGLGTCMLNWSRRNTGSDSLRALTGIGVHEEIIVLIAVGVPAVKYRVARSPRRPVTSVLVDEPLKNQRS